MRAELLLGFLLLSTSVRAEEEQLPDEGLLEFLAEMEAVTGDRFSDWLEQVQPDLDERGNDGDDEDD